MPKFSEQAHHKLAELGVETKLVLIPNLVHGFDAVLSPEDDKYEHIREAFAFLKKHAEKGRDPNESKYLRPRL